MLTNIYGKLVFECDCCSETLETNMGDLNLALQILREENWQAVKIKGIWEHRCPEHREGRPYWVD